MSHERLLNDLRRLVRTECSVISAYRNGTGTPMTQESREDFFKLESALFDIQFEIEQLIKKHCTPLETTRVMGDLKPPVICSYGGEAILGSEMSKYDVTGAFLFEWAGMFR